MQRTKQNHAWRVFRLLLIFLYRSVFTVYFLRQKQAENTVFTVDDLSGKKSVSSLVQPAIRSYQIMKRTVQIQPLNVSTKGNDAIQALKQGKIDAVVIDAQPAQSFVAANSDLMILPEEFANEDYAIAIAKAILP